MQFIHNIWATEFTLYSKTECIGCRWCRIGIWNEQKAPGCCTLARPESAVRESRRITERYAPPGSPNQTVQREKFKIWKYPYLPILLKINIAKKTVIVNFSFIHNYEIIHIISNFSILKSNFILINIMGN